MDEANKLMTLAMIPGPRREGEGPSPPSYGFPIDRYPMGGIFHCLLPTLDLHFLMVSETNDAYARY